MHRVILISNENERDHFYEIFDEATAFAIDGQGHTGVGWIIWMTEDGDILASRPPNEDDESDQCVYTDFDKLPLPLTVLSARRIDR